MIFQAVLPILGGCPVDRIADLTREMAEARAGMSDS
jgi:hypothetical protein